MADLMGEGSERVVLVLASGTLTRLAVAALLASVVGLRPFAGQGADPQRFVTRTDVVVVDVSVHDRQRQPVTGLQAADFTLLEDGRPQTIEYFQEIALPGRPEVSADWMREVAPDVARNADVAERRLIVILMDDAMVPFDPWMVNSARQIAKSVIDRLGPDDLAAVIFTRDNRPAQNFTNDRARLTAAANGFQSAGYEPNVFSTFAAGPIDFLMSSAQALFRTVHTLASLPERRKAIVFISTGFPLPVDSSELTKTEFPYLIWLTRQTLLQAQRGSVNIHPVDPAGLDGLRSYMLRRNRITESWIIERIEQMPPMHQEFLRTLADRTGGRASTNTNEFASRVDQILRDTGAFYLLGYRPAAFREDGRFRRLQVRVRQPGTTVTARTGYYAPSPPNRSFTVPPAAESALAGLLPQTGVPLALVAAPIAVSGRDEAAVLLTLGASPPAAARGTPLTDDRVDVQFRAFTPQGDARGATAVALTLSQARPEDEVAYEVLGRLDLRPGRYEIRASAASAAWASGSVYGYVDVPDFRGDPVSLSGLVLSADPARTTAPAEIARGLVPVLPTVRRRFAVTDRVIAFVRIMQGGSGPPGRVTMTTRIRDAVGKTVYELPQDIGSVEFGADRSLDHRVELPLGRLSPGLHLLTIEATAGQTTARRDVQFEVVAKTPAVAPPGGR